jgi:eukaryotic-like serine/threonine-protein kinase
MNLPRPHQEFVARSAWQINTMAVRAGVLPDRYADPRVIGRGGMGEIFLARDNELGRKVVVKVLDARFADHGDFRRRFRREALTAAKLSGEPHIVTIYDVGDANGRPFIVMEYLSGGSLADRARSAPISPAEAVDWLRQAGEALDAAHARGVVHRDIKPANLLFSERGELVVADFGIARAIDDTAGMTLAGTVMGTAGYLAPEQARGQPAGPASDRYGLAVVAYELLTGGRPFERGSETAEAAAHIHEPVPPASERGVGLPRAVDGVLERALAKDPGARYPSCAAFVAALDAALGAERTAPTRALPAFVPEEPAPPPRSPSRPRSAWLLPLLVLGLLAALAAGGTAAYFATQGSDPAPRRVHRPKPVTVTQRETLPSATIVQTITTTLPATTQAAQVPPPAPAQVTVNDAVALTDRSTGYLRSGDWASAWATVKPALPALSGTFSDGFRYEAYAYYDAGKALSELGRCRKALSYLGRSESLQGSRPEIDEAQAQCGG